MTEIVPIYGGHRRERAPVHRQPCACGTGECVEQQIWTATVLSTVRHQLARWAAGERFDGDAADVAACVADALMGRRA